MAVIQMSVSDWIDVPDNPRQRNTQKRAVSAKKKHLAKYEKIHRFVFAAVKQNSILCKLDGHTRALLWQSGDLETPEDGKVDVLLIDVNSIEEAKKLYDMIDASPTVKKPSDNIFGACRELGFRLDSPLLRGCAFATQLKIATTGKRFTGEIYSMVQEWKKELQELDSIALTSRNTILIAVMLVAIRIDGIEVAGEFFRLLDTDGGIKTTKGYNGVESLSRVMAIRRAEGRTAGWENLMQICGQAWSGYDGWKKNKYRKNVGLPIFDFSKVVADMNTQKKNRKVK